MSTLDERSLRAARPLPGAPARRARASAAVEWLALAVVLLPPALPFTLPAARAATAAPAPTLDERWLFDELNARRSAAGRAPLAWDATAYAAMRAADPSSLLEAGSAGGANAPQLLASAVEARRGYGVSWSVALRRHGDFRAALEDLLEAAPLGAEYNLGATAVVETAERPARTVAAFYACRLPPLLGRATLDGPAGPYRVRCPACKRERVYKLSAPRGYVSFDCPVCRTHSTPHLEDTRGALHWPTFFVAPYAPFPLDNPFLAWTWVNEGVAYDHPKADRHRPGWQRPAETARFKTGVCRDTSVLLAAWLHAMGRSARVVTGLGDGAPHAWVVLETVEARYLLETAYGGPLNRRYPPRLELAANYLPSEMMFDDRRVLLNRGQQLARDYDSPTVWFAAEELP